MITLQTFESAMANIGDKPGQKPASQVIADFLMKESTYAAQMTMFFGNNATPNPVTAALLCVALYETLRYSQEQADRLRKDTKGG